MNAKILLVLLAVILHVAAGSSPAAGRPNFLFIYTDDQRHDAFGLVQKEQGDKARFPWFQTPHMDRLAGQGVRFRNAFVVNSLCSPSRSCFLTGKYSHLTGVTNNHTPMPLDTITFAHLLKDAGYNTAYFGKFHHGSQKERPGFETIYSFLGQGHFHDCPFNINGEMKPTKGWVDDVSTDFAIDYIKQRKDGDKPFVMVVGYKSPHGPRTPPERAANRFEGEEPRPVPNLNVRAPYLPAPDSPTTGITGEAERPQRRRAGKGGGGGGGGGDMLNYFRTISAVDENLGRLMQTLDEQKLADNTIVVFTSDNGFYLGEHTLGDKRSAYEESLRIPMIVRYPRAAAAGVTRDEMVLNIDIAPTFLEYAGVDIPRDIQGASLRHLLDDPATPSPPGWRHSFFYTYFFERNFRIPTVTAVRTTDAKLVKYPGHDEWTELFDLNNDPYELKNLINDPAAKALREKLEAEYESQAKAVAFTIPDYADKPG